MFEPAGFGVVLLRGYVLLLVARLGVRVERLLVTAHVIHFLQVRKGVRVLASVA